MAELQTIPAPAPAAAPALRPPETRLLAVGLALGFAFLPWLALHTKYLWLKPHYQFAPLVLVGAGLLAARGWRERRELRPGARWPARLLVGTGWALLALAMLPRSPWLATLAALLTSAGLVLAAGGWSLFRRLLPAWVLLWLTLPPPLALDQGLIAALQGLTARGGSRILDWLEIYHVRSGTAIESAGRQFSIAEACSGVHSLNAALAATLFFALWLRRGPLAVVYLLLAATFWVLAANVGRITTVVIAGIWWDIDLSAGWRHEALGFLFFGAVLAMVWSSDRLRDAFAAVLLSRNAGKRAGKAGREKDAPAVAGAAAPRPRATFAWVVAAGFLVLAVVQLPRLFEFGPAVGLAGRPADLGALTADSLPQHWQGWKRERFDTAHSGDLLGPGKQSRVWTYRAGDIVATASLDYPFDGWHELPVCYQSKGWRRGERRVEDDSLVATFDRLPGEHGYLVFGMFDAAWQPLRPPEYDPGRSLGMLRDRLSGERPVAGTTYQFQIFIESAGPLTEDERAKARALYEHLRDALTSTVAARTAP